MQTKFASSKIALAVGGIFTMMSGQVLAGSVDVNGSTTVLPIMQQVTEAFVKAHPSIEVTISGTGSGNGIKALRDNMTDVAMSSRDLKAKEVKDFESHGMNPSKFVIAHDAIIPVVSPKNAVAGLTLNELQQIFEGKIKNWKEVGGDDARIVVVGRDTSSGTFESWQELVMKKARVSPRALLQSSSGGVVQAVSHNPYAIGYIGVGYLDTQIKGLSVNDVKPTIDSAKNGTWPISRELYLFTSKTPDGETKLLIDYAMSSEGQQFVEKAGFVPVEH